MRNREHLGCLRVREGVITLERMYFADEIRPIDEIDPGTVRVGKKELKMATDLIDSGAGTWKPERYRDTYRDRLLEVIEAKRKGEEVHAEPMPERDPPGDLLEALRGGVEAAKKRRRKAPAARSPSSSKTRKPSKRRKREPATSRR
jgi:DNA end-binding protein Ku